jgi:hypothetical protein
MQEALSQTQQELHYATQELQRLNTFLFEQAAERASWPPTMAMEPAAVQAQGEHGKQLALALCHQALQAPRQATTLRAQAVALRAECGERRNHRLLAGNGSKPESQPLAAGN